MKKIYLLIFAVLACLGSFSQTISIGNGTNTDQLSPWNSYYGYSYVQTIYLQSEIAAGGSISSISYYFAGSSLDNSNVVNVYIGHTSKSSFTNSTDWVPVSSMTQVFSGTLSGYTIPGWITIDLTTPFQYNDSDNLVIAVDENKPDYDGITRFNSTEYTGSNRVLAYSNDATNPSPATPPFGTLSDYVGNIQINGLTLQGCQGVSGVNVSAITTTSAGAQWTPPAGGSAVVNYNYELRTSGAAGSGSTGLVATGDVDTAGVALTSLAPGTMYELFVRTNCGATFSTWSSAASFSTVCTTANVPYKQDFESVNIPGFPVCTSIENAGNGNDWEVTDDPGSGFTNKTLTYSYSFSSAADAWFYTAGIQLTAGTSYRLVFKYGNNSTFSTENLEVKYGVSPASTDMSDLIVDLPGISLDASAISATDFVPATTGVYYFGFHAYSASNQYKLFVDDIGIITSPTCESPTDLVVSAITTSTAQIDWTPPSVSSPVGYQVYYSVNSTTPADTISVSDTTAANSYNLTNLSPATVYYVFVRSNCGNGDVSQWSTSATFTTSCAPVDDFTENFDGVTTPDFPVCWSKVGPDGTAYTQSFDAFSSPNTLYMYSNSTTDLAVVAMPPVSNLADGTHRLKFKARANFTVGGNIEIGYLTDPSDANSFTPLETITASSLTYQTYTVLPGQLSGVEVLAFRHTGDPTYSVLIDDVMWEPIPACEYPSDIVISGVTTSGAQVDWTPPTISSPAFYDIYYSTSNTDPDSTTTPSLAGIPGTTDTLTGLAANTEYYVWVRSDCGGSGKSAWSSAYSFHTLCLATDVPYAQDFESSDVPSVPECTLIENAGSGNDWTVADNPGSGFTSKTLNYSYNSSNAANAWFFTQGLNLTAGTSYKLTFKYGNNSTNYSENLAVWFGTSPSSSSMTDQIVDFPGISLSASALASQNFVPSATGVYYIGFNAYSDANQDQLYVDDIAVIVTPACDYPTSIVASNATATTAQLDWTAPSGGTPASYDIYYSTSNVAPSDSTLPGDTTVDVTLTLTNLTPASTYYVWIRSNCGTGAPSQWSAVTSFSTLCAPVPSFTEGFDNVVEPDFPNCWSKVGNSGSAYTQSSDFYSGPNTLYIYSNSGTDQAVVAMQPVSNLGDGTHRLTFKARANFTVGAMVEVGYLTDPTDASTFVPFETITAGSLSYETFIVTPGPVPGAEVLAFRHTGSPANSVLIDDVSWQLIPSCDFPVDVTISNIATNSAQADWGAPLAGSPVSYDMYVSTANTQPADTTVPTISGITNTTTQISGLQSSTTYFVWVRSNCGNGDLSEWTTGVNFSTTCDIVIAPTTTEPFENGVAPSCWSEAKGLLEDPSTFTDTTSSWVSDNYANVTSPTNFAARLNIYGASRNDWLITPSYDLGTGGNLQIEFDLALTKYSLTDSTTLGSDDKFAVLISTDNGATWTSANTLRLWDESTPISPTGEHIIIDLAAYAGVVKFAFYGESTSFNEDNDVFVDNFAITPFNALPVRLVDFKGTRDGSKNLLTWTTRTEQNNKGFELQRSVDGVTFTTIAFVDTKAAGGNSSSALHYVFADVTPPVTNAYYRLRQIDKDGAAVLSNIVEIKAAKTNAIVLSRIYPNPAKNTLNVIVSAPANDRINVFITDVAGKVVMRQQVQVIPGDNKVTLPVGNLLSGSYIIKAFCNNGCEAAVSRFIKQ